MGRIGERTSVNLTRLALLVAALVYNGAPYRATR